MSTGITPYIFFGGSCAEAFKFYERVLGGKIVMMMPHRGTPAESHTAPEWQDKILHARLEVGGQVLMASDAPPDHQKTPQGFAVSFTVDKAADAERVFAGLSEGGKVTMPMAATFFAERFGMLTDRFGINWMVNFPGNVAGGRAEAAKPSAAKKPSGRASAPRTRN